MTLRNPPTEPQIPEAIARDSEVTAAVAAHATAAAPHSGHMALNPSQIEFGLSAVNLIDFHAGTETTEIIDFDARILASGGINQNGRGNLSIQAARLDLVGNIVFSINGGSTLRRMLVSTFAIEPPSIPAGTAGVWDTYLSFPGAVAGDIALFCPADPSGGLWAFAVHVCVPTANQVRLFLRNTYPIAVDLPSFTARVIVLGF
jgi:hypothetical protein